MFIDLKHGNSWQLQLMMPSQQAPCNPLWMLLASWQAGWLPQHVYINVYIDVYRHDNTHILRCVFFVLSTYYNMMWIIIKMHNGPVQNVCSKHLVLFMPDIQRMLALLAGCHRHPGHLWPNAISSYHLEMVKTSIMSGQIDDGWTFGWTSLLRFFIIESTLRIWICGIPDVLTIPRWTW
jgi:hypothetical protein